MPDGVNLDMLRRSLLQRLASFKRQRGIKITVVFDAYQGNSPGRQRENYRGIDVVYSKEHETADDVIIGWIREKKAGIIVVSSDRAIIDEAKSHGAAFMTPPKMEEMMATIGGPRDDEAYMEDRQTKKKGNPRKLPKKLRKATKTVNKF